MAPHVPQDGVAENQVATVTLGWATETSMPEYNISNFKNV